MRNTFTFTFVAFASLSLAAQSQPASSNQQSVTVTGCLAAGPNNTFTLTAPDTSRGAEPTGTSGSTATGTTATTPTGSKVVKTVTYALTTSGPVDLKSQVGHTVEVTGASTPSQASATEVDRSTATQNPQGTSGRTPTVETTAQAQIVARQLTVTSVKPVSSTCDILK